MVNLTEINSETKKVSSYYFDIQQKDPDFDQRLLDEIKLACTENKVIAKDYGWDNFLKKTCDGLGYNRAIKR